jgi:hypothetical protein
MARRVAWVPPAVLAALVTGFLAWGAWVSARHQQWLYLSQAWWRVLLRPGNVEAPLCLVVLWLLALLCYWWPRRLQPQTVGLTTVVTMVVVGGVLSAASLAPCRGRETPGAVVGWVLSLYVGNPPPYPVNACEPPPPLALQVGGIVCLGATLVGALAAAAALWRQPVERLRARFVRDAIVFTGLDALTIPLLQRLAEETGRSASIVVIEPDSSHPLLGEARATGARVMIGQPSSSRILLPVIAGGRGCALRRLYALRGNVAENEAVLATANDILYRYRPDPERQPHLVVRIDDPRHADHWRGSHIGSSRGCFEDALSAHESTASSLLDQVLRTGARQLLLCGDSTLALAILRELARRAWERREIQKSAACGRAVYPDAAQPAEHDLDLLTPLPVRRVVLLNRRAEDLQREYLATSPPPIVDALPEVHATPKSWQEELLGMLDAMTPAAAAETSVVVADAMSERGVHEAGRVARLHPVVPVFVLSPDGAGRNGAIFDLLQPFQPSLLVAGTVPEDTWTRVARHWHECYRLRDPPVSGEPKALTRRPWLELDDFIRQDNILQLRSIMSAVAARGRTWVPSRAVAAGSFIELNDHDLEEVARVEHTRWYQRRLAAGWSAGDPTAAPENSLVNSRVVPWEDIPSDERAMRIDYLRSQIAQLEDVGFIPAVPAGGPARAAEFRRIGTVQARRLQARRPWTRLSGEKLHGEDGDWRVVDDSGDERTVRDQEFRRSHEALCGEFWRRTGIFRAWQVSEALVLRTIEGRAVAGPGDWVVEGYRGERWPVSDRQFRRTYRQM